MGKNPSELQLLDRIKECLFRQGGNVYRVADELKIDVQLVRKFRDKIHRRESFVVRDGITLHLIDLLCFNHLERTFHLREMLRYLENKHEATVSCCCEHIVVEKEGVTVCLKCNLPTTTKILDRFEIYDMKSKMIDKLREEDTTLVDNAVKLKIPPKVTDKLETNIDKRTFVNIGQQTNQTIEVSKEIKELSPLERDQLRRILEQEIRQDSDFYVKPEKDEDTETETQHQ